MCSHVLCGTPRARAIGRADCSPERVLDGPECRRGSRDAASYGRPEGRCPLSPARYCEKGGSGDWANLVRKMEQNRMVCSFMPIVGKNSGYGGDCPGEHPNDSGRTQSRTQPSKPRHCLIGETCGRQSKGKEIPSRACATPERCALVCARSEARSIIDVSKVKKEHSREAVEGRRGLMCVRERLVPVAGHLSRARLIMCHLSSCCAGRSRGVAARRRILSARWQPTRGMFLGSR